ncbi:MAG: quinolinate synthase NadA [Clostridiales bacterium]
MYRNIVSEIDKLKKHLDAVIVAHSYQNDEVQEIADIVGDSFALSKFCAESDKKTIVVCGVHFMAESAKILSPDKTILLPEIDAGCPMADMVTPEALIEKKNEYPEAVVVCYINSSAIVKSLSYICCTSSNAESVVRSINKKQIIFVPDKNLGNFVSKKIPEKEFIFWDGFCETHNKIRKEDVILAKKIHGDTKILVHPECREEVVELADFVGSTKAIIDYAKQSKEDKFIIGTEMGVLYRLKKDNPNKEFYMLSDSFICNDMKKISLESIRDSLLNKQYEIKLDKEIIKKANKSLERMLEVK